MRQTRRDENAAIGDGIILASRLIISIRTGGLIGDTRAATVIATINIMATVESGHGTRIGCPARRLAEAGNGQYSRNNRW